VHPLSSLWQSGVRIIQLNDCSSRHYGQLSIINNNDDNGTMVVAGGSDEKENHRPQREEGTE